MKFIKYYHRFAWGNQNQSEIKLLGEFDSDCWNSEDDMIKELCEELREEYSYKLSKSPTCKTHSDKYRGIEYNIIEMEDLTNKEKIFLIEEYENNIRSYQKSIEYFSEIKKILEKSIPCNKL